MQQRKSSGIQFTLDSKNFKMPSFSKKRAQRKATRDKNKTKVMKCEPEEIKKEQKEAM